MAATTSNPASQLNVVFDGTWIYIPNVDASGNITGVSIYSPACGHPHAGLFLSNLGPFGPTNWPQPSTCYMLDSHGLNLAIQRSSPSSGMPASGIDQTANHFVNRSRPIASSWDLVVSISASRMRGLQVARNRRCLPSPEEEPSHVSAVQMRPRPKYLRRRPSLSRMFPRLHSAALRANCRAWCQRRIRASVR